MVSYQQLKQPLKRLALGLMGISIAVLTVYTAPPQAASAAGCRHYDTATPTEQTTPAGGDGGKWYYGETKYIPRDSSCNDINLVRSSIQPLPGYMASCASFRIRFYPTSGGSYTNPPKFACNGINSAVLATSVKNGTKYRVESNQPIHSIYLIRA